MPRPRKTQTKELTEPLNEAAELEAEVEFEPASPTQNGLVQLDLTGEGQPLEDPTLRYAQKELLDAYNLLSKQAIYAMGKPDDAKLAIEDAMKHAARAIQYLNLPEKPRHLVAIAAAAIANEHLYQAHRCLDPEYSRRTVEDIFTPLAKAIDKLKIARRAC